MSELINERQTNSKLRWQLLATVSALALTAHAMPAIAQDESRPTVWIELGGQYEDVTGRDDPFIPPFDAGAQSAGLPSINEVANALGKSFGGEGSLSFQPRGSDWIFMVSARYGRTHTVRHGHGQKPISGPPVEQYRTPSGGRFKTGGNRAYLTTPAVAGYADQNIDNSEAHAIVDFEVGRDVGLGLFGHATSSIVSFGARYAQLSAASKARSDIVYDADFHLKKNSLGKGKYYFNITHYNSASTAQRDNSFHAFGPSISLSNSTGLFGNKEDGNLAVDWGLNAAVLFGRQKTEVHHQSTIRKFGGPGGTGYMLRNTQNYSGHSARTRNVIVPNVGGFAAISYRFTHAKLSAGYRADFFFGALDRGLDTHDSVTTGFHGPFATVSFGLGG